MYEKIVENDPDAVMMTLVPNNFMQSITLLLLQSSIVYFTKKKI
jgi:hypothetical protein